MGRDDWFRNEIWDADIEAAFRAKLARARSAKPQYLRIQAGYLTKNFPDASLLLIDEFFALGDHFEFSIARCVQARAFEVQGRIGEAIDAYELALQWDADHPRLFPFMFESSYPPVRPELVEGLYLTLSAKVQSFDKLRTNGLVQLKTEKI
jgi:hypothetical protein